MALTATFKADFSAFTAAVAKAEVSLKDLEADAGKVGTALNKMAESFSGKKVISDALLATKAIGDIANVTKLTTEEQKRLNAMLVEGIAKYTALGKQAPADMLALAEATKKAGDATKPTATYMGTLVDQIKATALGFVSAQAVIGGVQAGFRALTDFVSGSIQSFSDAEAASKKLATALASTGKSTPEVIGGMERMAAGFQKTTVYSNNLITEMQALLVQIGNVAPSQMQAALTASTNLASGLGIDLQQATTLVAKAFAGSGEELGRLKAILGDSIGPGQTMAEVLGAIEQKFGGQAAAEIETYAGKVKQLSNEWDTFKETVGKAIVLDPNVERILNLITKGAQGAAGVSGGIGDLVNLWLGPSAAGMFDAITAYNRGVNEANKASDELGKTIQKNLALDAAARGWTMSVTEGGKAAKTFAATLSEAEVAYRKLSTAQVAEIEAAFKLGAKNDDIIRQTKVSADVLAVAKKAYEDHTAAIRKNTEEAKRHQDALDKVKAAMVPLTDEQKAQVVALDKLHVSTSTMAEAYGISADAAAEYLASLDNAQAITDLEAKAQIDLAKASHDLFKSMQADHDKNEKAKVDASTKGQGDQLKALVEYQQKNKSLLMSAREFEVAQVESARDAAIAALDKTSTVRGKVYDDAKQQIETHYQHEIDIINKTQGTLVARLSAQGIATRSELRQLAEEAERDFAIMRSLRDQSGKPLYTPQQIDVKRTEVELKKMAAGLGPIGLELMNTFKNVGLASVEMAKYLSGASQKVVGSLGEMATGLAQIHNKVGIFDTVSAGIKGVANAFQQSDPGFNLFITNLGGLINGLGSAGLAFKQYQETAGATLAGKKGAPNLGIATEVFNDQASSAQRWAAAIQSSGAIAAGALNIWNATVAETNKAWGALKGAMGGAQAGAVFGPLGAAIGAAAGALTGFLHSLFGAAGRDIVKEFAASKGGFDALHTQLLVLGDAGEQLWIKLTQGVGRNNPQQAKAVVDEVTAALQNQSKTIEDMKPLAFGDQAAQAGYKTIAELQTLAAKAVALWEYMRDSGSYSAEAVQAAWEQANTALVASGDAAATAAKANRDEIKKLTDEYQSLSDSIAGEAPEEFMGSVEKAARERMAAIAAERKKIEDEIAASSAAASDDAKDKVGETTDAVDKMGNRLKTSADEWSDWADEAIRQVERVAGATGSLRIPSPGASSGATEAPATMAGYASGTNGFVNFGSGTPVTLHGWEKVTPRGAAMTGMTAPAAVTVPIVLQIGSEVLARQVVKTFVRTGL